VRRPLEDDRPKVDAAARDRLLLGLSVAIGAAVFTLFVLVERPGLGIGYFYVFPIALAAVATGPIGGGAAGAAASALFGAGVVLNSNPAGEALSVRVAIRLLAFCAVGVLTGWFARRHLDLVEELRLLAERDFLTGLPNARAFDDAVQARVERGERFTVLLGDVDELKSINDRNGHPAGDDALRHVGDALRRALRGGDEVARIGGDEFAILAPGSDGDAAGDMAQRLESVVAATGYRIRFGWALHPQDGADRFELTKAADERLYARKALRPERRLRVADQPL
jgi:diguanylate cyclase (GGDEF)-like protein